MHKTFLVIAVLWSAAAMPPLCSCTLHGSSAARTARASTAVEPGSYPASQAMDDLGPWKGPAAAWPPHSTAAQGKAAPAATTGSVEFAARVQPEAGRPEPVRQLTFFLLRKSFADIQAEAERSEPKPDLDKFIEGLTVSDGLKAWMKRTRVVDLSGGDFLREVKTNDILQVQEFFEAYLTRNAGDNTVGFPATKAKDTDRAKNPEKYERDQREYKETLRTFIMKNPHTRDGLDLPLSDINPAQRWLQQEVARKKQVHARALELAELSYTIARADTNLEGAGSFSNVPAGDYWISSLEGEGVAGDVHLRWDAPVPVRAGRVTRVILSNVNAAK
jgi:hypothetical protein